VVDLRVLALILEVQVMQSSTLRLIQVVRAVLVVPVVVDQVQVMLILMQQAAPFLVVMVAVLHQ